MVPPTKMGDLSKNKFEDMGPDVFHYEHLILRFLFNILVGITADSSAACAHLKFPWISEHNLT